MSRAGSDPLPRLGQLPPRSLQSSSARALRPAFSLFGQTGVRWPVQRSGRVVSCFPWPSGGPLVRIASARLFPALALATARLWATVKTLGDSKIWATGKMLGDKQDARRLSDLKVIDFRTSRLSTFGLQASAHTLNLKLFLRVSPEQSSRR